MLKWLFGGGLSAIAFTHHRTPDTTSPKLVQRPIWLCLDVFQSFLCHK
ncbi:hypothetical protein [Nostoc sp.]